MTTSAVPNVASRAGRLVRAMELVQQKRVRHLRGTEYVVRSGDEDVYVDLSESEPCHCGDSIWRSVDCKHRLAVHLYRTDPTVVKAIADMLTAGKAK